MHCGEPAYFAPYVIRWSPPSHCWLCGRNIWHQPTTLSRKMRRKNCPFPLCIKSLIRSMHHRQFNSLLSLFLLPHQPVQPALLLLHHFPLRPRRHLRLPRFHHRFEVIQVRARFVRCAEGAQVDVDAAVAAFGVVHGVVCVGAGGGGETGCVVR